MKHYILALLITISGMGLFGQGPNGGRDIESLRVGFITKKLQLTPEEAQVFWPVYNKYQAEMKKVREGQREQMEGARGHFDEMSDSEVEKLVDNMLDLKKQEMDISLKYHDEFKKVLPIKKVAKLYKAEHEFTRMLLEGLQQRRGGPPGGGGPGGGGPNGDGMGGF